MSYVRTFSSLGCPELNLEQMLLLASRHGMTGVELRAVAGSVDVVGYLAGAFGTPQALAGIMRTKPAKILALDTSLRLADNTPEQREDFLKFLPWAEALGVRRLRVFDGGKPGDAASLGAMAETVKWWRQLRTEKGWRADLMVETHDALFTASAIEAFQKLAPDTGILWDTHHTWKIGCEDPLVTWRGIRAQVVHVHVKDSVSIPHGNHSFSYRLPGEGEFPMAPLREVLRAEYSGPVSLEWERMWIPELAPLEDALSAAEKNRWF